MTKKKFVRRDRGYSKLGKGKKKKKKWRRPKGRDNKVREKRKSRPPLVSIGYRKKKEERGKIDGKKPKRVENLKQVDKIKKDDLVILGKVGKKKKEKLIKKVEEKGAKILNKPKKENEKK